MQTKLRCELNMGKVVGHIVLWIVLSVVTLGLALFVYPYSFGSIVINSTYVVDAQGRRLARLRCPSATVQDFVAALLWWLLTLVTFGVGGFFFAYYAGKRLVSRTEVITEGSVAAVAPVLHSTARVDA